jgi:hypothetical protein
MTVRSFTRASGPQRRCREPRYEPQRVQPQGASGELLWIRYGSMGEHRRTCASQREDQRGQQRAASARSVGPRRNKWVVLNIQATATNAPNVADRADVISSIELASAPKASRYKPGPHPPVAFAANREERKGAVTTSQSFIISVSPRRINAEQYRCFRVDLCQSIDQDSGTVTNNKYGVEAIQGAECGHAAFRRHRSWNAQGQALVRYDRSSRTCQICGL